MSVPAGFDLGPHHYTIDTSEAAAAALRAERRAGDSVAENLSIRIDPALAAAPETVLHEAMHCAWNLTSLRCTDGIEDHEEQVVSALAPYLLELLRRNPDLVKYLCGDKK